MVEQWIENPCVSGSIPLLNITLNNFMKNARVNLLICLKNMSLRGKEQVTLPFTKKSLTLLNFLYKEGLIQHFYVKDKKILVVLKNFRFSNPLFDLKVISKPSYSLYLNYLNISKIKLSKKIFAVSTAKGLVCLNDCYKKHLGGKLLFST